MVYDSRSSSKAEFLEGVRLGLDRVLFVEVLKKLLAIDKLLHGSPIIRPDQIAYPAREILELSRVALTFPFGV